MNMDPHQLYHRRVDRFRLIGVFLLLISAVVVLLAVENLLVSSILAFVIAYLIGPWVNYLERQGIDRVVATTGVFFLTGVALVLVGVLVFPNLGDTLNVFQSQAPKYITGFSRLLADIESRIAHIFGPLSKFDVTGVVESYLTNWTQGFFDHLPGFLKQFVTVMLLGPFLAFFMVKDGRSVLRQIMSLVPNNIFEAALSLQHQINQQIGQFVRARLLEALIVGGVTWVGLVIIGFPFAVLLALFAALTNLIPYLGPIIGFAPALMIALVNGSSSFDLFLLTLVYLSAQLIDAAFIIPLVVAKIVDLHPVTVIIVIIAGAQVMGVLGMIISIPVASTFKVTIGTIYRHLTNSRA